MTAVLLCLKLSGGSKQWWYSRESFYTSVFGTPQGCWSLLFLLNSQNNESKGACKISKKWNRGFWRVSRRLDFAYHSSMLKVICLKCYLGRRNEWKRTNLRSNRARLKLKQARMLWFLHRRNTMRPGRSRRCAQGSPSSLRSLQIIYALAWPFYLSKIHHLSQS